MPKHPYNRAERWVSACDTVAQLYVDVRYDPAKELAGDRFTFPFPYHVGYEPYNVGEPSVSDLEKKIAEALVFLPRRGRRLRSL